MPRLLTGLLCWCLAIAPAAALCGNGVLEPGEECDDGTLNGFPNSCCSLRGCTLTTKEPDVLVGDITAPARWGTLDGITAYSIGTTSCNLGSCWLNWFANTPDHPVIGQNMFRLKDGRFEQLGQSWLKHGFVALSQTLCGACDPPPDGTHLGVNCSDPYDSALNGTQSRLGPKSAVNPATGLFPYPDPQIGTTGNVLFKRLQVRNEDLDPAQNAGAVYFLEAQYVARDDARVGNQANNTSYRRVLVGPAPSYVLALTGPTEREKAGIEAWKAADPAVTLTQVTADGLFVVGARVTPLPEGGYHYEYAVQNLTSDRAARTFTVPIPAGTAVTEVGFHDVGYHSGEPFDGTDWAVSVAADAITWETQPFTENPNANALRWGTLYNFRFDADVAPGTGFVSLGLFKPGTPGGVAAAGAVPGACAQEPGEVDGVRLAQDGGTTTLTWNGAPGAAWSAVLRGLLSGLPVGPGGGDEACVTTAAVGGLVSDGTVPDPGTGFWYLVQGRNACGGGTLGAEGLQGGPGATRASATCP